MKRVNVLFVMPVMGMGGSERLVHNIALRLDRDRFNPSVAWLSGSEPLKEFEDLEVPLHYIPKTRRIDFFAMQKLARIIQTESIDVVSAQHFMPAIYAYYGCKLIAKKALFFTAHSRWELEDTSLKWRLAGGYLLRRIDASIGVTRDVSHALQTVFNLKPTQTLTIENGVDIDLLSHKNDVGDLRSSLGLAAGDRVIGIVANLKRVKNHLFLLRAFCKVAEKLEDVKLMIVGQSYREDADNTEEDLRQFVINHHLAERVLFMGYRTDIPEIMQIMDIFCLVSLREGLPIGLIEAMAAARPVVVTNVEGIRDVIEHDKDGMLVESGDVKDLANTLVKLLNDSQLRHRLGTAARYKAVENYSLKRCVEDYEKLFLAAAHPSRIQHNAAKR